ncbi:MAG: chromate transporter [Erysipelotrichaceae bacterium]|nr:chromate transporter [Erysipelotrichaceae bacterium]
MLFTTAFSISMTANSGYAMLSVMKNVFAVKRKMFSEDQMNDFIGLAQSAPGPVAVNGSLVVGYQVAGFAGGLSAVLGCIMPPIIMMILVTIFYSVIVNNQYVRIFMAGMQAGVAAMLLDVIIGLFKNITKADRTWYPFAIMVFSFLFIRYTKYSVFFLVLICIATALIKTFMFGKKVVEK